VKLIAGLGNPGTRYRDTRHNVGFRVVDALASRAGVAWESAPAEALAARWRRDAGQTLLVKPLTFMNLSGEAVAALMRYYRIGVDELLVVVDDVNLPLGRLRARRVGSAGGHNGLKSVAEHLGSEDFARLRVGVGRGDGLRDLSSHVTAKFEEHERDIVEAAVTRAADAVEVFLSDGVELMMSRFNAEISAQSE